MVLRQQLVLNQTADSFIDAPTTDSIVSKDNQAFYDAQQQTQDALSFADSLNPQSPTFTPTAPEPVSGTPGVGKPGEVNPYGTTPTAPEPVSGTPGVGKPGEVNPYGTTPTAPAAGISYDIGIGDSGITSSPTLTDDLKTLKAPETKAVAPVEKANKAPVIKYFNQKALFPVHIQDQV